MMDFTVDLSFELLVEHLKFGKRGLVKLKFLVYLAFELVET